MIGVFLMFLFPTFIMAWPAIDHDRMEYGQSRRSFSHSFLLQRATTNGWMDASGWTDAGRHTHTHTLTHTGLESSRLYQPTVARTRIACVGDSITFGWRGDWFTPPSTSNYPAFLQQLLGPEFEVFNLGEPLNFIQKQNRSEKFRNSYWTSGSFGILANNTWDVILIMLGTNDARDGVWKPGCEESSSTCPFVVDYNSMIRKIGNLGKVPGQSPMVFLMVPPPIFWTEKKPSANAWYPINTTIVNTVIPQLVLKIAEANHLPVINLFEAFGGGAFDGSKCDSESTNKSGCGFMCDENWCDELHPDDEGFRAIAFAVADRISAAK